MYMCATPPAATSTNLWRSLNSHTVWFFHFRPGGDVSFQWHQVCLDNHIDIQAA